MKVTENTYELWKKCGCVLFRVKNITMVKKYGYTSHYLRDIKEVIQALTMCICGVIVLPITLIFTLIGFLPTLHYVKGIDDKPIEGHFKNPKEGSEK